MSKYNNKDKKSQKQQSNNHQLKKDVSITKNISATDIILYTILIIAVITLVILVCWSVSRTNKNNDLPVFLNSDSNSETTAETIKFPETTLETLSKFPLNTDIETSSNISPKTHLPTNNDIDTAPPPPESFCLDVENILQNPKLPNGCEVVSLAIVLNYFGYNIDPVTLYNDYMPNSNYLDGNPWTTYVGNATGLGLGCYAPCVKKTGDDYLKSVEGKHYVRDVSYKKLEEYEQFLREGKPIIMWGLLDMTWNPHIAWGARVGGKEVIWYSYSHCLVLIGYTEDEYIFCDPLEGIMYYNKNDVIDCFTTNFKQACILEDVDFYYELEDTGLSQSKILIKFTETV